MASGVFAPEAVPLGWWDEVADAGAWFSVELLAGDSSVQISQVWFGVLSGAIVAAQTVGDFTQTATATVDADASAAQTVGDFAQTATAEADAPAADFVAAQQVGDFAQSATAECDGAQPAVQGATPGYVRSRYRVRVGRRWVEVDPTDQRSVQAAFAAAELAGAEAAETRVVAPKRSAARTVVAMPADAPAADYGALAADAQRIAEQVREVYAQALQRELIARLIRASMERDEDEAVLLLLG